MHHLHYFTLRAAAQALHQRLVGTTLVAAFSQQKDECVLAFDKPQSSEREEDSAFYLRIGCANGASYLMPSARFQRARANSADVLSDALGHVVQAVLIAPFERLIQIVLVSGIKKPMSLVLRLQKHQSNVLLFAGHKAVAAFRHDLPADLTQPLPAELQALNGKPEMALQVYQQERRKRVAAVVAAPQDKRNEALKLAFPVLDAPMRQWILAGKSDDNQPDSFERSFDAKLKVWERGLPVLAKSGEVTGCFLTPLPVGYEAISPQPSDILNLLEHTMRLQFGAARRAQLRQELLDVCEGAVRRLSARLSAAQAAELAAPAAQRYETYGHMLLAYLHLVPERAESVELPDFETGEPVRIALDAQLNAQQNAEVFYQKAKDAQLKRQALKQRTAADAHALELWQTHLRDVQNAKDARALEALHRVILTESENESGRKSRKQGVEHAQPVFRRYVFEGYMICVGRNAKNNDELTFGWAHKNDLWLHARDVKGSHVVIRRPDSKPIPANVQEYAAGLAAFWSKARGSSLVPVSVTERKYLRKSKRMAPGAVVMERETVLMVEPFAPEGE